MKTPIFYRTTGLWFLRIGDFMLHAKNTRQHKLTFSERNGYGRRALTVCGWRFSLMLPIRGSNSRAIANLLGAAISGFFLGLVVVAVIAMPPFTDSENDRYAQAKAEAKMKARLFSKYPDPAIAQMSAPVSVAKERK